MSEYKQEASREEKCPKLSIDNSVGGWDIWKAKAERSGLTRILSNTALMMLWLSLGSNVWRDQ